MLNYSAGPQAASGWQHMLSRSHPQQFLGLSFSPLVLRFFHKSSTSQRGLSVAKYSLCTDLPGRSRRKKCSTFFGVSSASLWNAISAMGSASFLEASSPLPCLDYPASSASLPGRVSLQNIILFLSPCECFMLLLRHLSGGGVGGLTVHRPSLLLCSNRLIFVSMSTRPHQNLQK